MPMTKAVARRSDRDLQDALITYLADAKLRRVRNPDLHLSPQQSDRAHKFARFLARRYYRDRLARSFRYSRRFGTPAEAIADTPFFDHFLDDCVLGSLAAAEQVSALTVKRLSGLPDPPPWWSDLLEYERLFFLQAATTEVAPHSDAPQPALSTRCHRFSWNVPRLLGRLKAGETIGDELQREITLLFSRAHTGRIYVIEVDEITAAVFCAADGRRSTSQIASLVSLPAITVEKILGALMEVGALAT